MHGAPHVHHALRGAFSAAQCCSSWTRACLPCTRTRRRAPGASRIPRVEQRFKEGFTERFRRRRVWGLGRQPRQGLPVSPGVAAAKLVGTGVWRHRRARSGAMHQPPPPPHPTPHTWRNHRATGKGNVCARRQSCYACCREGARRVITHATYGTCLRSRGVRRCHVGRVVVLVGGPNREVAHRAHSDLSHRLLEHA